VLKNLYLHVGIPCYGGLVANVTLSSFIVFSAQAPKHGLRFMVHTLATESLIPRARNRLVSKMMEDKRATHLIFIDADIGFKAADIFKLISHDVDVVGGLYPKKSLPIEYSVNAAPNAKRRGSLIEVEHLETGFMLIKRNVFEKMFEAHPELKTKPFPSDNPDVSYALFDTILDSDGHYLSEDRAFCQRVKKTLGIRLWADLSIKLDHRGAFNYAGDLESVKSTMERKPKPKAAQPGGESPPRPEAQKIATR
jgi:hypothetical protein